ncbi:thiamine-phosphate kinase [Pseudomonas phenolilytica]|uniref:thiamine-phosphate kinase n=1 Tax=Pseudomonas phenolilytica TaxID=2746321 RepID=UPI0012E9DA7E|nr:thiamine-phosphate kinase [Pseudomonas phenolilytica]QGW21947.1 thiamine-phosphate kinase [Stutzerimonas degradans]UIP86503.1 thiamine-phosphate kinase [Pseudomonas phenolilytica]
MLGEFELIRHYFAAAACARAGGEVVLGIGDDCALLDIPTGEQLAVSTDTLVAGVHFPDSCDPFLLGQRALAVAASDLAGMGATPIGFTLALTLPAADALWLAEFARGLDAMALDCSLRLIGGDTTRGPLCLTVTVFGRVPAGQALVRSGAQVGDLLCVGGVLGEAAGALPLVLGQAEADADVAEHLLARYWSPQPQLALGEALRGRATAALDISDGLLADCGHIAKASSVALRIERERVPLSAPLQRLAGTAEALRCALAGGDDYVLTFTLPPAELAALQDAQWPVHVIGCVTVGQGVQLVDAAGNELPVSSRGYNHFHA